MSNLSFLFKIIYLEKILIENILFQITEEEKIKKNPHMTFKIYLI